jgi:hypothetical protein
MTNVSFDYDENLFRQKIALSISQLRFLLQVADQNSNCNYVVLFYSVLNIKPPLYDYNSCYNRQIAPSVRQKMSRINTKTSICW